VPIKEWIEKVDDKGVSSGFGNDWLKFDATGEMPIDGGVSLHTAFMRSAYPDNPNNHGQTTMTKERLLAAVSEANEHDWRVAIHCVGDAACDWVPDAYENANREKSIVGRRFALIHGSLLQRDQLERAKKLSVILELQNVFMWDKAATVGGFLGAATANRVIPDRTAIDVLGIDNVSLGTDYPVNDMNPFIGLYVATTRRDPRGLIYGADQGISREEALRLYTSSAAYASFDEKIRGTIERGKLADTVVLSADYMTVPLETIKDIKPVETIVGGKVVFHE
jgi:predicted amidohydrolase YtcJ